MSWVDKLQSRWHARNVYQVMMILLVFCLTGITVVYLMKPILKSFFGEITPLWAGVAYYVFILPVYNGFLLLYGFIFGQFPFFWNFEKRLFVRILSIFKRN